MIWGAMSSAGVGPLCFLKTNVTASGGWPIEGARAPPSLNHTHKMKFRHVVFKLSSGGARQILRLISTGGTQSR